LEQVIGFLSGLNICLQMLSNMTENPSIIFSDVSKRYRLGISTPSLRNLTSISRKSDVERYHWALRNVSFEVNAGEALGIIGPNGAGKTTILKLLSKITHPTTGKIKMNGRFSSLIELGAGFHPDLTGRDNIYLNGTILGMSRQEINARFDQIVDFAEIGSYLDTPVKRYSSGMYARLGFSVAAHVDPDILIVDEVLAVGDMAFRKKCYDHMLRLINNGTTLVFVSHDFSAIQTVCPNCLVMYRGNLFFRGTSAEATAEYSNILRKAAIDKQVIPVLDDQGLSQMVMTREAVIEDVKILRSNGQPSKVFQSGETVCVQVKLNFHQDVRSPVFACTIRHPDGQIVYDYTTHWANISTTDFKANSTAVIEFQLELNLVGDTYYLGVDVARGDLSTYYDKFDRALDFVVTGVDGSRGRADLMAKFQVKEIL
jgi:lipopolysaccharide transport system ATP-binding protein